MSKAKGEISFDARYKALNEKQKQAVDTTEGPVLVIAGPGSGKTELLAIRIGHILKEGLASPAQILCLTFTDNAALNMRERLSKLIGPDAYRVGIFTFHSFCNHIIGRYPEHFYNAAHYTLANDVIRAEILESLFKNLPHKHVFASYHPSEGYVYLRDIKERIKHIKAGGYTPEEFALIVSGLAKEYETINKVIKNYPEGRMSIKRLSEFNTLVDELSSIKNTTSTLLTKTLKEALLESEELGKTEPLSKWKKKYTVTDDTEVVVLKDAHNLSKIEALIELYVAYEKEMHDKGYYDYDDMIIDVAHVLRDNAQLRHEIEEQYQYILIDEFQDTNEAQMNLVRAITGGSYHEGRPNVLVVGDDDQAIYKFQGAEISHVINFRTKGYKDVETIVLDKNYRSTEDILALARTVITQGKNRLENYFDDINKVLTVAGKDLPKGTINIQTFNTDIEEYSHVASSIKKAIEKGVAPEDIAVLARGHRELKALLPYLDKEKVPYEYIKKANVFDEPHIKQLIIVCNYLSSVLSYTHTADYLLPEILSFPFWNIRRSELFLLASIAKKQNIPWLEAAMKSNDGNLQKVAELIMELHAEASNTPLPHLLELFMEKSGFKDYYFSKQELKDSPSTYIYFLASLKTFIEALREYKEGEIITASDVGPFVALHQEHDIPLVSESIFTKSAHSVQLLSAHASKGLEFGHVYLLSAHDALWTKAPRVNKAPLPSVLSPLLTPAGDNEDDFIRLLYVAITRAKHTLHITAHDDLVRYFGVVKKEDEKDVHDMALDVEAHMNALGIVTKPFKEDEWAVLEKLVENYQMPVTHLSNFVNVLEGGPLYFIEQNLLRFPQPMIPSAVFGSATHKAIEEIIMYKKFNGGDAPTLSHILAVFTRELSKGRLPPKEHLKQLERGEKVLEMYYNKKKNSFLPDDSIEVDMKDEGVIINGAHLTGKLDFLRTSKDGYEVVDFKTGDTFVDWDDAVTDYDKIKLHKYKTQLIVYKLLLENSNHYKNKVAKLSLEFVEEEKGEIVTLSYTPTNEEVERVRALVEIVYKKITTLDFPDTEKYEKSFKGILAFEEDLLKGNV